MGVVLSMMYWLWKDIYRSTYIITLVGGTGDDAQLNLEGLGRGRGWKAIQR